MEEKKVTNQPMQANAPQNEGTTKSEGSGGIMSTLNIKYLVTIVLVLAIGIIIGLVVSGSKSKVETTQIQPPAPIIEVKETIRKVDPLVLDDPLEILDNLVFTEWLGSVEGELVEKNNDSFVIQRSGEQLEIFIKDSFTAFFEENESGEFVEISYEQLPLGSVVRGGVTVSRGSLTGTAGQHVVANAFTILSGQ